MAIKHTASLVLSALALSVSAQAAMTAATTTASQGETTNRLIVKYATPVSAESLSTNPAIARITGGAQLNVRQSVNGTQVVDFGLHQSVDKMKAVAAELAQQADVVYAEPDYIMKPMAVPNDTRYNEQWHYFEPAGGMNLPTAWDITTGSGNVTVAVIDTGVRPHADLAGNLLPDYDFISDIDVSQDGNGRDADANDPGDYTPAGACGGGLPRADESSSWHGTHVAGTIAAASNNGQGIAGVSWQSRILPVRVLGRCGGYTSDITEGMLWAAGIDVPGVPTNDTPAQVLNLSLGGRSTCGQTYRDTISQVRATGATVVVAAGNDDVNASGFSPASCEGVVTVASNKRDGGRAYYSNYGDVVDVAAPGGETRTITTDGILSTLNSGTKGPVSDNYAFYQGTSMAAPHVAGVAALMYAEDPAITPDNVERILKTTARAFPSVSVRQCTTALCGAGIVDAASALQAVNGDIEPPATGDTLSKGIALNNLLAPTGETLQYTIDVPQGATDFTVTSSGGGGDADLYVQFGQPASANNNHCKSEASANAESCVIAAPSAGTWHVTVSAYRAFSELTLLADYQGGEGHGGDSSFTNDTVMAIPDGSSTGIVSGINSSYAGKSGNLKVAVDIDHTYRGDIKIQLLTPDGASHLLKDTSNSSKDNVKDTYTLNLPDTAGKGLWQLQVSDLFDRDTGTLNRWSLLFSE